MTELIAFAKPFDLVPEALLNAEDSLCIVDHQGDYVSSDTIVIGLLVTRKYDASSERADQLFKEKSRIAKLRVETG